MKAAQHVGNENNMENSEKLEVKPVEAVVFNYFKNLISGSEKDRLNASCQLLQHLSKNHEKDKRAKELQYTLKRLTRGVGASTTSSRAGFFTSLVGFLKIFCPEDVDVETVLDTAKKELHVGNSVVNKEDADALVGQVLVCGALLRSEKIFESSPENISRVVNILISSSKHRSYHNSLAYSFLNELLLKVDESQLLNYVWPQLEVELKKPWEKQTINTVNCLITVINKFPNVANKKYIKAHFGGHQLLNSESFKYLLKIFWDNTSIEVVTHPAFVNFAKYISDSKHLESFWISEVSEHIKNSTRLREIVSLKILTDILENADANKVQASKLLTNDFVKMITSSLKGMKLKKDETLKAFYDDFFEALNKFSAKVSDDSEKVEIIHKLILWPGNLSIEKYTSHRIVHQIISHLGEVGIQKLFETYKQIFLDKLKKNPENTKETWLNIERQNAGFMLHTLICHKQVQMSFDWRAEQLKFMLTFGLFYTNENGEIVTQKEDCGLIKNEFSEQLKNAFYSSLQSKLPKLEDERKVLLSLVEICDEVLQRKHYSKYLRNRIDEKILKAWKGMYAEVHKKKKRSSENPLRLVFHILLLHMGLQLFREPEMAEIAISDLEKCMEKAKEKSRKTNSDEEGSAIQEPEWIEVVVDLFLHLLSQNNSALRNIVNTVFPHLCSNISLTAMHQILSVLNMKDGNNPLSDSNEDQEEEQEDEEDEPSDKNDDVSDDSSDENEDEDEEEEEEEEEIIEEEEEEGTFTDKLRNAVSTALGTVGKDDDQVSVDLDDMDEEEGKKLDEALTQAFKLIKSPEQNKKSKAYRVKTTTIMHFRIRVLDLIEIYIQHGPSLIMSLEIMLSLYNMIEYCGESELKPLCTKIEKVLSKLTALRHFSNTEDVTEQNICDFLRMIIEKKVRAPVFEVFNKLRAKCTVFLIACGKAVENSKSEREISNKILSIIIEYLNDFIKLRNPTINITLLNDIFKMRWQGIWNLAVILSTNGLSDTTRVFRRIQIIELLNVLYRSELIRHDLQVAQKHFKSIESSFQKHIQSLANKDQISVREFTTILDVLFTANRCHSRIPIKSHLDKEIICECIQKIRQKVKLDNTHSYNRFCTMYGLEIMKNSKIVKPSNVVSENGKYESGDETEEVKHLASERVTNAKNKEKNMSSQIVPEKPKGKRKNKVTEDFRKEKKLKKEKRLQASSEGLNGGISFVNTSADVEMLDDVDNSYRIGSE